MKISETFPPNPPSITNEILFRSIDTNNVIRLDLLFAGGNVFNV